MSTGLVASTSTPGNTAPEVSVTTPETALCASVIVGADANSRPARKTRRTREESDMAAPPVRCRTHRGITRARAAGNAKGGNLTMRFQISDFRFQIELPDEFQISDFRLQMDF